MQVIKQPPDCHIAPPNYWLIPQDNTDYTQLNTVTAPAPVSLHCLITRRPFDEYEHQIKESLASLKQLSPVAAIMHWQQRHPNVLKSFRWLTEQLTKLLQKLCDKHECWFFCPYPPLPTCEKAITPVMFLHPPVYISNAVPSLLPDDCARRGNYWLFVFHSSLTLVRNQLVKRSISWLAGHDYCQSATNIVADSFHPPNLKGNGKTLPQIKNEINKYSIVWSGPYNTPVVLQKCAPTFKEPPPQWMNLAWNMGKFNTQSSV